MVIKQVLHWGICVKEAGASRRVRRGGEHTEGPKRNGTPLCKCENTQKSRRVKRGGGEKTGRRSSRKCTEGGGFKKQNIVQRGISLGRGGGLGPKKHKGGKNRRKWGKQFQSMMITNF